MSERVAEPALADQAEEGHPSEERHAPVAPHSPRDDRWPDRFALGTLAFALFVFVVAIVPPWHDTSRSPTTSSRC